MSSKSSHKKPPTPQDPKKDQQQLNVVKLRRKESTTNKNPQPDNQRKSVMFRFLHRDKKKNPELPEHGFIPDARRVLDGPSKSLTVSQGVASDVRNRWSSYEPVDFSQLSSSSNKTEDTKQDTITTDDNNTTKRSISHDNMPSKIHPINSPPPSIHLQNEPSLQSILADDSLANKMKKIDEKLDTALSRRRKILVKLLKTPSKFFNGTPELKPLLYNSFLSSETITKLASNSMNSPGNVLTFEDIKILKQNILELQKNLSLISDAICSNSKERSSLPSTSSSSLSLDSIVDGTPVVDQKTPATNVNTSTDLDCCWKAAVTPLLSDNNEAQEMLTKIDEENETMASIENVSSHFEPSVPLIDVHLMDQNHLASMQIVCQGDSSYSQNDPLKLVFRKEKMIPILQKSSSTTCFSELRIHSSIAEEDEDAMIDKEEIINKDEMVNNDEVISKEEIINREEMIHKDETIDKDEICYDQLKDAGLEFEGIMNFVPENTEEADVIKCPQYEEIGFKTECNIEIVSSDGIFGGSPGEESFDNDASDDNNGEVCTEEPISNIIIIDEIINKDKICDDDDDDDETFEELNNGVIKTIIMDDVEPSTENDILKNIMEPICTVIQDPIINNLESSVDEDHLKNINVVSEPTVAMMSCSTKFSSVQNHVVLNNCDKKLDDMEINNGDDYDIRVGDDYDCGQQIDQSSYFQMPIDDDPSKLKKCEVHDVIYGDVVQESSKKVEVCMTSEEGECIERLPFDKVVTISETPEVQMFDDLKVENVEVLICSDERLDSLESVCDDEDDASDKSTPANSDACETNNSGSNEGGDAAHQVSLPPNKTGNNKNRKRNKRKKKNQQQANNNHEKTSPDSKNICISDSNSETIVLASR